MIKGSKGIIDACFDDTFYNNTRISHRNLYFCISSDGFISIVFLYNNTIIYYAIIYCDFSCIPCI
nr:MAG TPA: hypothetical protein [Inoviridae sp.]